MTQHVGRLPLELDPLIAEAKQRMRKRRALAAVLAVVLVAGAIGATLGLRTSHSVAIHRFVATRPVGHAFARHNYIASWGDGPKLNGQTPNLHFVSLGRFALGIVLKNEASQVVTLTGVSAVLPSKPMLRQLGTRIVQWNWAGHCPNSWSCAGPPAVIYTGRPIGAVQPQPLQVAPGKKAGVQLNFQFGQCSRARHAPSQRVNRIVVTYRSRVGTLVRQRVALGPLTLSIEPPAHCPG
jgi:hypothetical protein